MWRKKTEANKEIRVYLKRNRFRSCSRVTPGTAHRTHQRPNEPACAPPRLPTEARMRTSLVMCCCVFALHCFPSTLCLPVRGSSRFKVAAVSWRTLGFVFFLLFFLPLSLVAKSNQKVENLLLLQLCVFWFWFNFHTVARLETDVFVCILK